MPLRARIVAGCVGGWVIVTIAAGTIGPSADSLHFFHGWAAAFYATFLFAMTENRPARSAAGVPGIFLLGLLHVGWALLLTHALSLAILTVRPGLLLARGGLLNEAVVMVAVTGVVYAISLAGFCWRWRPGLMMFAGTIIATAACWALVVVGNVSSLGLAVGIALLHASIVLALLEHAGAQHRPGDLNRCPRCGYDVYGVPGPVCPECGTPKPWRQGPGTSSE